MPRLTLRTLLYMMREEDYEIRYIAETQFVKSFRDTTRQALKTTESLLRAEEVSDADYEQLMNCKGIGSKRKACLQKEIEEIRKNKLMPIEPIMEMYRSGNETLKKIAKTCTVSSFEMFVFDLIHKNYPTYATKYYDELYQSGIEGLLTALENYNADIGKFTTHAKSYILHELSRQINFHNNDLTPHFYSIQKKITNAINQLHKEGVEVTESRIQMLTKLKPDIVKRELEFMNHTNFRYLDDENDTGLQEIEDVFSVSPEKAYTQKEKAQSLQNSIDALDDKERNIIKMKFYEGKTNEQIAKGLTAIEQQKADEQRKPGQERLMVKDVQIGEVKTLCNLALRKLRKDPSLNSFYTEYQTRAEDSMNQCSVPVMPSEEQADVEIDDLVMVAAMMADSDDDTETYNIDDAFDTDLFKNSVRHSGTAVPNS